MGLLLPEEHIIFMEMCTKYEEPAVRLPADDIKKLVDAGIKTCMSFGTFWDWIEPKKGVYDWSYYDDRIKLLNDCGMKVIFHAQTWFPSWIPDNWLVKTKTGNIEHMISPWNDEAWEYAKNYYTMVRDRYNSDKNLVMCSWLSDGESLFPAELCCYDDHALSLYKSRFGEELPAMGNGNTVTFICEAYVKIFTELQLIASKNQWNEIWTCMHPALKWYVPNSQNTIEFLLESFKNLSPETTINHLYCTWSQWQMMFTFMNGIGIKYGNVFGGAEYATGIIANTSLALKNGLRGLLLGCCHPHTGYIRVEDWMLDNIKQAMLMWQK